MTTTASLSGDEIPKRLKVGSTKASTKNRRKIMKDAIISFDKEKKKKKKKTAKDVLKKTKREKDEA